MSTAAEVKKRIAKKDDGTVISYEDFDDLNNQGAVALALSRLCKQNIIKRLQRGRYYKPKQTKFGELVPSDTQVVKGLLGKKDYVTGIAAFNRLGLTTQVPNEITIKGKRYPRNAKVGKLMIRYRQGPGRNLKSKDQLLLPLLDALSNIKRIPGADVNEIFRKVSKIVQELGPGQQKALAKLSLKYKPAVRALAGTILQDLVDKKSIERLKASLNPLTVYKIGLNKDFTENLKSWRVK